MSILITEPYTKKLEHTAYDLFRKWCKNVQIDFPNADLRIKNEEQIVEDFFEALFSSLKNIDKKDKSEGFKIGYVEGFIKSYLSSEWYEQYIFKHTEDYRYFCLLSSLESLFEIDIMVFKKIENIYNQIFLEDCNLLNPDTKIKVKDFDIQKLKLKTIKTSESISDLISNQRNIFIANHLKKNYKLFFDDNEEIIDSEIIKELIRINVYF